jgi:hypothetical protein
LHRESRIRLVVGDREVERTARDPAGLVHARLERDQCVALGLPEERSSAGHRDDDVDLVRVGRRGRKRDGKERGEGQSKRKTSADWSRHGHSFAVRAAVPVSGRATVRTQHILRV